MDVLSRLRRVRIPPPQPSGVVAVALAAGFVVWLATGTGSAREPVQPLAPSATTAAAPPAHGPFGPVALGESGLRARARGLGQPLYWVGSLPGRRYELSRDAAGNLTLRYLPSGVKAGDPRALLTVGTYPFDGAYAATRALRKEKVAASRTLPDGGFAFYRTNEPTSVYLVYRGLDYQVEVFSPSATQARRLVYSGRVRTLPG
jgi:hypothetical protein